MTKAEALQAMREGKKVTHCYFQPHEWMMIKEVIVRRYFRCHTKVITKLD